MERPEDDELEAVLIGSVTSNDSGLSITREGSPDIEVSDLVAVEFGILAWLLDIKKCLISAKARCLPPAILNLLDVALEFLDDILGLEYTAIKNRRILLATVRSVLKH